MFLHYCSYLHQFTWKCASNPLGLAGWEPFHPQTEENGNSYNWINVICAENEKQPRIKCLRSNYCMAKWRRKISQKERKPLANNTTKYRWPAAKQTLLLIFRLRYKTTLTSVLGYNEKRCGTGNAWRNKTGFPTKRNASAICHNLPYPLACSAYYIAT